MEQNTEMELKICRVCLSKTANISIFSSKGDIQFSIKIMRCVNVVVTEGDGLPDSICISCAQDLYTCYDFVNKCEASDKVLRGSTSLLNDIVAKSEQHKLDIKAEDIKQEPLDEPDNGSDDEFLASFLIEQTIKSKNNHKRNSNTTKRLYKKTLGFYDNLIRRKKDPKSGPLKCSICGLLTNCKSALDNHMRTHTGEKPYACDKCGAQFNLKGTMKRHILSRHTERERKFTCETCGSSFYSKASIQSHVRIHTKERPYTCTFCGKAFTQVASMIRHKRTHTGERPYSCRICSKTFIDKSHLSRHLSVHSDEKNFTCNLCNKAVKSRNALKAHMVTHSNEKHNICNYCGMTFSMKGNLKSHIQRVHSEKSGDCSICNKTFSDLETHMRKHTGEKPIVCKLCERSFTSKRSLANHMSFRHDSDGKFKCSIGDCAKAFPTAMMLEFHVLKQHTNHTPYICHHCSRGFFRLSDLSRHLKLSHMDTLKFPMKSLVTGQL